MTGFITPLLTFAGYRASKRFGRGCKPRPALVGSRKSQITLENWRNGVYNPVTHLCRLSSIQTFRSGLQTSTGIVIEHPKVSVGVANPDQHWHPNVSVGVANPDRHWLSSIQTFQSGLQTPTGIGYQASKRFGRGCKPRPALAFKGFSRGCKLGVTGFITPLLTFAGYRASKGFGRGCKPRSALVGSRKSQITLENWRDGVYNPVTHLCRLSSIQRFRSGLQTPIGIGG